MDYCGDDVRTDLVDSLNSCELYWQKLLCFPGLPEDYKGIVVEVALLSKKRIHHALQCATGMFKTNMKCMAHTMRLKQEIRDMEKRYFAEKQKLENRIESLTTIINDEQQELLKKNSILSMNEFWVNILKSTATMDISQYDAIVPHSQSREMNEYSTGTDRQVEPHLLDDMLRQCGMAMTWITAKSASGILRPQPIGQCANTEVFESFSLPPATVAANKAVQATIASIKREQEELGNDISNGICSNQVSTGDTRFLDEDSPNYLLMTRIVASLQSIYQEIKHMLTGIEKENSQLRLKLHEKSVQCSILERTVANQYQSTECIGMSFEDIRSRASHATYNRMQAEKKCVVLTEKIGTLKMEVATLEHRCAEQQKQQKMMKENIDLLQSQLLSTYDSEVVRGISSLNIDRNLSESKLASQQQNFSKTICASTSQPQYQSPILHESSPQNQNHQKQQKGWPSLEDLAVSDTYITEALRHLDYPKIHGDGGFSSSQRLVPPSGGDTLDEEDAFYLLGHRVDGRGALGGSPYGKVDGHSVDESRVASLIVDEDDTNVAKGRYDNDSCNSSPTEVYIHKVLPTTENISPLCHSEINTSMSSDCDSTIANNLSTISENSVFDGKTGLRYVNGNSNMYPQQSLFASPDLPSPIPIHPTSSLNECTITYFDESSGTKYGQPSNHVHLNDILPIRANKSISPEGRIFVSYDKERNHVDAHQLHDRTKSVSSGGNSHLDDYLTPVSRNSHHDGTSKIMSTSRMKTVVPEYFDRKNISFNRGGGSTCNTDPYLQRYQQFGTASVNSVETRAFEDNKGRVSPSGGDQVRHFAVEKEITMDQRNKNSGINMRNNDGQNRIHRISRDSLEPSSGKLTPISDAVSYYVTPCL